MPPPSSAKPKKTTGAATKSRSRSRSTKASRSGKAESHALVKDLDLSGGDAGVSLRDFCQQFATKNARQRNLIFAVYLRDHTGVDTITADHIYTCWRSVDQRAPDAFNQSLWDTGSKEGWLDTGDLSNITVSTRGQTGIDHDIPKADAGEGDGN